MVGIKVLLVDDKAATENYGLEERLTEALSRIDDRIVLDWQEPIIEFSLAKSALSRPEAQYDLVFVDALWPRWDRRDTGDQVDELIRVAREFQSALIVMISRDDRELFTSWYSEYEDCRPHAILSKESISNARILRTMLEMGFSSIQKPLRSTLIDARWERANEWSRLPEDIVQLAAVEILAKIQPKCVSAKFKPIGGGLSGASTILAETSYLSGTQTLQAGYLLKLDSDSRKVLIEETAHRTLVRSWPAALFAALVGSGAYGGLTGIAFSQVWAASAESQVVRIVDKGIWGKVFSKSTSHLQAASAERVDESLANVLRTGALRGDRIRRYEFASVELGVGARERSRAGKALKSLESSTGAVLTIQHCDLHTRNVLVTDEGAIALVDAASMSNRELWCSDLARFAVWTALGLVEVKGGSLEQVAYSLCLEPLAEVSQPGIGWASKLHARVTESLKMLKSEYDKRSLALAVERDWDSAVMSELMRATYSSDWFGREARMTAALAVTRAANALLGAR